MALDSGYLTPSLAELITRIGTDLSSRIPGSSAPLRRSLVWALTRTLAGVAWSMWQCMSWATRQVFADSATSTGLDRLAAIWDVVRVPGVASVGTITLTGTAATVSPEGTIWRRDDGLTYSQDADATIPGGGSVAVAVTCLSIGADGNAAAGRELSITSPIAGLSSTAVVVAIEGGQDDESDDELRDRLLERIAFPPHGGSAADYVAWAKEVAGVADAWCYPLEGGAGKVTVRFCLPGLDSARIPDAGDIAAVQAYLDTVYPVTATVTAAGVTAKSIAMTIAAYPNTVAVQTAITEEIDAYFLSVAPGGVAGGGRVRLSNLNEAISRASGEEYHTLTVPNGDVVLALGEIPIRGTITWI